MTVDCVFCGIVAGSVPSVTVASNDSTVAFMDINPASEGHLLVVPRRHSTDLLDIPVDDLTAVMMEARRIAAVAINELGADGINLLNCSGSAAWQTVFHFHLHVVPRYTDERDTLRLPWRPDRGGDSAVIEATGTRLRAALA